MSVPLRLRRAIEELLRAQTPHTDCMVCKQRLEQLRKVYKKVMK